MPIVQLDKVLDIAPELERGLDETSDEPFDRTQFALEALELVRPADTTVAVCPGASSLRIASGRAWGRGARARWAVLTIPPRASRRAIALAVAELAQTPRPYVLDLLFS